MVRNLSKANYWDDSNRAVKLPAFLKDEALIAFNTSRVDKTNHAAIRDQMLSLFSNVHELGRKFYTRDQKPGESVRKYAAALQYMAQRMKLDETGKGENESPVQPHAVTRKWIRYLVIF